MRFVLLAVSNCRNHFFVAQCIIKQLLDSVFVKTRIIKVSVKIISRSLRLRLVTPTWTLTILDITKTSSNDCLKSNKNKLEATSRNSDLCVETSVTCKKSQHVNGIMSSTNPISLENLFKIRPVEKRPLQRMAIKLWPYSIIAGNQTPSLSCIVPAAKLSGFQTHFRWFFDIISSDVQILFLHMRVNHQYVNLWVSDQSLCYDQVKSWFSLLCSCDNERRLRAIFYEFSQD